MQHLTLQVCAQCQQPFDDDETIQECDCGAVTVRCVDSVTIYTPSALLSRSRLSLSCLACLSCLSSPGRPCRAIWPVLRASRARGSGWPRAPPPILPVLRGSPCSVPGPDAYAARLCRNVRVHDTTLVACDVVDYWIPNRPLSLSLDISSTFYRRRSRTSPRTCPRAPGPTRSRPPVWRFSMATGPWRPMSTSTATFTDSS